MSDRAKSHTLGGQAVANSSEAGHLTSLSNCTRFGTAVAYEGFITPTLIIPSGGHQNKSIFNAVSLEPFPRFKIFKNHMRSGSMDWAELIDIFGMNAFRSTQLPVAASIQLNLFDALTAKGST